MNKKNTLLLQLFSIAVLLFFLFQMLGPAISNFLSFGHSKITTQHVVGNGTITAFLSSARFVPSSDNGKYVTILSNLSANGTINYHEQESGATTFYEITFSNASNIGVVRDMLSPYGTFLVRASIKPLNSTNMQLSLLVSGYHSVGDTVPVQYDVEMRDDKVLSISNGALLPSNIAIDQDVNITDTGAVTLEVYLPSEDDDFVNLMKKYNVSVSYLPLRMRFGFWFDPDNNKINEYIIGMGRTFGDCTMYDSEPTIMLTETIHIDDDNKKYYVTNLKYTNCLIFDIIIGGEYFYYPKDYFGPIEIDSTFGYYVVTDEKKLNKKRFGGEIGLGITPFYKKYLSFDVFIKVDEKGKVYETGGIITVRWGFDHSELVDKINNQ